MDYKNLIDLLTKLENNASGSFLFSSNNRYNISRDLAISYYEKHDFKAQGSPYDEDGIPHVEMLLDE